MTLKKPYANKPKLISKNNYIKPVAFMIIPLFRHGAKLQQHRPFVEICKTFSYLLMSQLPITFEYV